MRAIIRYTDPEGRSLDLIREVRRTIHNKMPADYKGPDVPNVVQKVLFTREEVIDDDGKKFFTEWHADDPLWPEYDPSNEVPGFKPDTNLIVSKKVTPDTESEIFTVDYTRVGSTESGDQSAKKNQGEDYASREEGNLSYGSDVSTETRFNQNGGLGEKEAKSSSTSSEGSQSTEKEQEGTELNSSSTNSPSAGGLDSGSKNKGEDFDKILADQIAQAAVEKTKAAAGVPASATNNANGAKEDVSGATDGAGSQERTVRYSEGSAAGDPNTKESNSPIAEASSNPTTSGYGTQQEQPEPSNNNLEMSGQNIPESRVVTNSRVIQIKPFNNNSDTASSVNATSQSDQSAKSEQANQDSNYPHENSKEQRNNYDQETTAVQGYQGGADSHQAQGIDGHSKNIYKPTEIIGGNNSSEDGSVQGNKPEESAANNRTNDNESATDTGNDRPRIGSSSASQIRDYTPFVGSVARMHEDETPADKDPRLFNEGEDVSDQYVTTKINGEEVVLSKAPVAAPANKMQPEPEEFVKPYKVPRHARLIPLSPKFSYLRQDKMTAAMLRKLEIIGYFYFEDNEWKSVEFDDSLLLEATLNNPLQDRWERGRFARTLFTTFQEYVETT